MKTWETPEIVEVKMDAEIGSYQEDFGNDERFVPFASPEDETPAG
jgi:hypothetical protein